VKYSDGTVEKKNER